MLTRSRKRALALEILEDTKMPKFSYPTFKKFSTLCSELRAHVLSFSDNDDRYEYAQCSRKCREEIEHFKTNAPNYVSLESTPMGIEVMFSKNGRVGWNLRLCKPPSQKGRGAREMVELLARQYKYIRNGTTQEITVKLTRWPIDMLKIPQMIQISSWQIFINKTNFPRVEDLMKGSKSIKELKLVYRGRPDEFELPNSFFKTESFRNLEEVTLDNIDAQMSDDDFLASKATYIAVQSTTLTENGMNRKIRKWYEGTSQEYFKYTVDVYYRNVDEVELKRGLPLSDQSSYTCLIHRPDGKIGALYYHFDRMRFCLWES